MLYAAFLAGVIGSTHCIFMCGPIFRVSSEAFSHNFLKQLFSAFLYSIGRTAAYVLLGVVVGAFNYTLEWINFTTYASIFIGLLFILKSLKIDSYMLGGNGSNGLNSRLFFFGNYFKRLLKSNSNGVLKMVIIGFCNGFLPCGLVYAMIGFCIVSNSVTERVFLMSMFGLGTCFVFFALALIPHYLLNKNRVIYLYIQRAFLFLLGILFIYRGLYVEVPYLDQLLLDTSLQRIPLCE